MWDASYLPAGTVPGATLNLSCTVLARIFSGQVQGRRSGPGFRGGPCRKPLSLELHVSCTSDGTDCLE